MKKYKYDSTFWNWKGILEDIFEVEDLSKINEDLEVFKRENDQNTKYHKLYYDFTKTPEFRFVYERFIQDNIRPLYNESIVYQAIPTFRICYSNNIAVGEFHKDKNYRNIEWAEIVKEDNFFLPFTNAFGTNTIWVESKEDKGDFKPIRCDYGEFVQWDGSNLTHGNKINKTRKTRVSVDFRVVKLSNYIPSEKGSINTNSQFKIGGYYSLME